MGASIHRAWELSSASDRKRFRKQMVVNVVMGGNWQYGSWYAGSCWVEKEMGKGVRSQPVRQRILVLRYWCYLCNVTIVIEHIIQASNVAHQRQPYLGPYTNKQGNRISASATWLSYGECPRNKTRQLFRTSLFCVLSSLAIMTFINGTDLFVFANVAAQYGGINLMLSVAPINFQRSEDR